MVQGSRQQKAKAKGWDALRTQAKDTIANETICDPQASAAMIRNTINVALALPLGQPGHVAARQVLEANNAFLDRHHCHLRDQVDVEVLRYATTR